MRLCRVLSLICIGLCFAFVGSAQSQPVGEGFDQDFQHLNALLDEVEPLQRELQSTCTSAQKRLEEAEASGESVRTALVESFEDAKGLQRRVDVLKHQVPESKRLVLQIKEAGRSIQESVERVTTRADSACLEVEGISTSLSQSEREARMAKAKEQLQQIREEQKLVDTAYEPVPDVVETFTRMWEIAEELGANLREADAEVTDLERQLVEIESILNEQSEVVELLTSQQVDVQSQVSTLDSLWQELLDSYQSSNDASVRQLMAGLERRISAVQQANEGLSDCLDGLTEGLDEMEQELDSLASDWSLVAETHERAAQILESDGLYWQLREDWLTVEASQVVTNNYLAQLKASTLRCEACIVRGDEQLAGPIMVVVPDVQGMTVPDALDTLDATGLKALQLEGSLPPFPALALRVEWQQPPAGRKVAVGEQIALRIYGPSQEGVDLPNLVGMSLQEASEALEALGLSVRVVPGEEADSARDAYTVSRQDPPEGRNVENGSEVELTVYGSFSGNRWIPNVLGLYPDEATLLLSEAGLEVRIVQEQKEVPAHRSGRIVSQDPAALTRLREGTMVTLVVYTSEADRKSIPNFDGMSQEQAIQVLGELGYSYSVSEGEPAPRPEMAQTVYSQDPPAGAIQEDAPTTVILVVYGAYKVPEPPGERPPFQPGKEGMYVACRSYFPKLPNSLPEGQKYRDWIRRQSVQNLRLAPTEAPVFLYVGQEGLRAYDPSFFANGNKISSSIEVTIVDSGTGRRHVIQGALLLEVMGSFDSYTAFTQQYPPQRYASEGSEISFIRLDTGAGTFREAGEEGNDAVSYSGGPFQEGWSSSQRTANLVLYRGILDYFDCFIASVALGRGDGEDLDILRAFRDEVLAQSVDGQRFIDLYYQVGPHLAWHLEKSGLTLDALRHGVQSLAHMLRESQDDRATQVLLAKMVTSVGTPWLEEQKRQSSDVIDPFSFLHRVSNRSIAVVEGEIGDDLGDHAETPAKHATTMGDLYLYGEGVPVDYNEALKWYLKAAELGVPEAMNNAAYILEKGLADRSDVDEAARWYQKAAEAGLPISMNNLGWLYYNGLGVERDLSKAKMWYEKGAQAGNPNAQANLAWLYLQGVGVERDPEQARSLFREAAEKGLVYAQYHLGSLYYNGVGGEVDYEASAKWYLKAAEKGHAQAQAAIGWLSERGLGVPRNYEMAADWYRKAAEQKDAGAQNNLGWLYETGKGVQQSYEEAAHWYRQAAESDMPLARSNLGVLYLHGRGVPQDDAQAFQLFSQAAHAGEARAQNNLGYMYESGRGVQKNPRKAEEWYLKGAQGGDSIAQYNIGRWYEYGMGGRKDMGKALHWYQKAAEGGQLDAIERLRFLGAPGFE